MTMSVIEARVDALEQEVVELRAVATAAERESVELRVVASDLRKENVVVKARLDRRRHWWISMFLAGLAMAIVAILGAQRASQGATEAAHAVVREAEARAAEVCRSRNEALTASRTGWIAILQAQIGEKLVIPDPSPLRLILQNDVVAKLRPITC